MAKKVSGFTFIKNGLTLGYPIKESIQSIEPLCDEIVINVGFDDPNLTGDDGTHEYLRDSFPSDKFKFIRSWWDPEISAHGMILSQQTNIALEKCTGDYCQYIQGDEAIHEEDLPAIEDGIRQMEKNLDIDGLIFNYIHFYGNVDIYKYTRNVYRREVRLIRGQKGIKSWLDAQGFRAADDTKIKARLIDARVFHYGWARKENVMNAKVNAFEKLYHGKEYENPEFKYEKIWGLKPFTKTHPAVMKEWIETHRNDVDIMQMQSHFEWKNVGLAISDALESLTGYRMGEYKNYRRI
ncbi:MAG: glycosyltransferase family 2 protein [Deltaproteobacteria bacterium]|nr:MAG: glycosyltransferase family 2 protein [Deltaproteobacteria bacterium]TNF28079.1 MAG: glycosyltransferase family 2 protein [Deltaproteobacteria bacterium]